MKVEIWDWNRQVWSITSTNPTTIGAWFAEMADRLISADARMQDCRIHVWPQTHEEHDMLRSGNRTEYRFTQDDLLALAQCILDASAKLGELECSKE